MNEANEMTQADLKPTPIERLIMDAALVALGLAYHHVDTCDRADRETFMRAVALSAALSQACDAIKARICESVSLWKPADREIEKLA
jgi:hypothetical protein